MNKTRTISIIVLVIVIIIIAVSYSYHKKAYAPASSEGPVIMGESGATSGGFINSNEKVANVSVVTAYIKAIDGNKITLDYFDLLVGADARKSIVQDGGCTQKQVDEHNGCFPNGELYFRNKNPQLRTFNLASNVQIIASTAFQKNPSGIVNLSLQELKADPTYVSAKGDTAPYRITLNDKNEVIKIEEIFRP